MGRRPLMCRTMEFATWLLPAEAGASTAREGRVRNREVIPVQLSPEEWDNKVAELQEDHVAAGGFITKAEAREIVTQALGPRPSLCERCASRPRQKRVRNLAPEVVLFHETARQCKMGFAPWALSQVRGGAR